MLLKNCVKDHERKWSYRQNEENKEIYSYKSEITSVVENTIQRNFRVNKPNEKMLTVITEFSIPVGNIYLSLIIDYFD